MEPHHLAAAPSAVVVPDAGGPISLRRELLCGALALLAARGAPAQGAASGPAPSPPAKPAPPVPSADFGFESRFVDVLGSRMHYVEAGQGEPVLFLHGIPTSAYLWRNVLPFVAGPAVRAIAVDHIGYGRSDQPAALTFSWLELARHLEGFIQALGLRRVTLVAHDLGGAIGLHWASKHPGNVRAFAYLEAALPPAYPRADFQSFGASEALFRRLRDPVVGRHLLVDENFWIETFLPASVMRTLSAAEMAAYREPFLKPESRRAIYDMVQSLPIAGQPAAEWAAYEAMARWWRASELPKLVMYGSPSRVTRAPALIGRWPI
jgi:haloalkane dehalogenase